MSAQHTPGVIRYDYDPGYCGELIASNGTTIATFPPVDEADARRLVACWNALLDAPTELLERAVSAGITDVSMGNLFSSRMELQAQRDELLAALSRIAKWNEHTTEFAVDFGSNGVRDFYRGIASRAIRAIAKVEGGAV